MSGWQLIASAPRDGTEVLLASIGQTFDGVPIPDRVTLGHYTVGDELLKRVGDCGGVCRCPEYEDIEPFWMSWDGGFTEENPPTGCHFRRHLPSNPPPPGGDHGLDSSSCMPMVQENIHR